MMDTFCVVGVQTGVDIIAVHKLGAITYLTLYLLTQNMFILESHLV